MLHPRQEDKDVASVGTVVIATAIFVFNYPELTEKTAVGNKKVAHKMLHFCPPKLKPDER